MDKQTQAKLLTAVACVANMATGILVGYRIAEHRLAKRFDERLKTETEEMREFYTIHRKKYPTPEAAVVDLIGTDEDDSEGERAEQVAYHKIVKTEYDSPVETPFDEETLKAASLNAAGVLASNIFESKPDPEKPYIISQDDYMQNDAEFTQATLTYYVLDNKLTDEREDLIDEAPNVVGIEFQDCFGQGSSDENVVHVRNERLRMDFEVVRSDGAYAKEVLGMDELPPEPKPSARQRRGD